MEMIVAIRVERGLDLKEIYTWKYNVNILNFLQQFI